MVTEVTFMPGNLRFVEHFAIFNSEPTLATPFKLPSQAPSPMIFWKKTTPFGGCAWGRKPGQVRGISELNLQLMGHNSPANRPDLPVAGQVKPQRQFSLGGKPSGPFARVTPSKGVWVSPKRRWKVSKSGQLFPWGRRIVEWRVEVTLCRIGKYWRFRR
jgi:hypothetical protein